MATHKATPKATSLVLASGKRGINLRSGADAVSQDIGDLNVGQTAEGTLVGTGPNQWMKIEIIDDVAVVSPTYCAAWLCDLTEIVTEPPVRQPNVKVEITFYDDFTGLVETYLNDDLISSWTGRLKPPPLG